MYRHYFIILTIFFVTNDLIAQTQPSLEVEGSIQIGDDQSSTPDPGTIRWNPATEDFEGWTGTAWKSLTFSGNEGWVNTDVTESCALPFGPDQSDLFGNSVDVYENTAIVGGRGQNGRVIIFRKMGSCWENLAELVATDGETGDQFGFSVSITENYAVVGAPGNDDNKGKAYVYVKPPNGWSGTQSQATQLIASIRFDEDRFGHSVAISGDVVIVGAHKHDTNGNTDEGKAYLFEKPIGGWPVIMSPNTEFTSSDGSSSDNFGHAVSISGTTVVIGAHGHDTNNQGNRGKAYLFEKPQPFGWPTNMMETHQFQASDGKQSDRFGFSVCIDGGFVIVGATSHDVLGISVVGKAYVFQRSPLFGWSSSESAQLIPSDGSNFDRFGHSVSISENNVIVGSSDHNTKGIPNRGKAYLYQMPVNGWASTLTESAQFISSDGATQDFFGNGVSIYGGVAIVGAPNYGNNEGKAYIFERQ